VLRQGMLRHAELGGDLMKSWPSRSRQSVTDLLFGLGWHSGAAEGCAALRAARFGPGNASAHPLDDPNAAFELGEHAHFRYIAVAQASMPC
jgi:hypothetical protein